MVWGLFGGQIQFRVNNYSSPDVEIEIIIPSMLGMIGHILIS